MRVAYLVNQYPGLTHTFIRREIQALEGEGIEVRRFALRLPDEAVDQPRDAEERARTTALTALGPAALAGHLVALALGRPLRFLAALGMAWRMGRRSATGLPKHLFCFVEACALARLSRAAGCSHVHVHFGTNGATVALLAHRLGGPPWSLAVHGAEEFDKPEFIHLGEKVADASFVTAVSHFAWSQTCRWSDPADWSKVSVVRCTVEEELLEREPDPVPDVRDLVCVGRMSPAKGHLLLVEAAARLRDDGVGFRILLIGDGPLREHLERAIRERDLGAHVTLAGALSEEQVFERMRASRGLVQPSFIEGLPVTVMEAMALARPVVASAVAGIPELVEDGVSGLLVVPGDAEALARALRRLLEAAPSELRAMGCRGREVVRARHRSATEGARLAGLLRAHSG